jgi:modification methylase
MIVAKKEREQLTVGAMPIERIENQIILGDVLEGLSLIPDESVHLICTSPPYNCNIPYGNHNDGMPWKVYLDWLFSIWKECSRVLVSGGRMAINIDSITNRQNPEDKEYIRPILAELVFQMRQIPCMMYRTEIAWYKQNVAGRATAWGSHLSCSNPVMRRNHEHILVWSKDSWRLEGDSELSDMTQKEFEAWTMSAWHIQPETKNLGCHPAIFPEEMVRRVIKLYSYRENLVLDPFCGSGTTCVVAASHGRRYIGIDNHKPYVEYAERRIEHETNEAIPVPYVPRSERLKIGKKELSEKEAESVIAEVNFNE